MVSKKHFIGLCLKVVLYVPKIYDIVIIEMKSQQSFSLTNPERKDVAKAVASFCMEKSDLRRGLHEQDKEHNPRIYETID